MELHAAVAANAERLLTQGPALTVAPAVAADELTAARAAATATVDLEFVNNHDLEFEVAERDAQIGELQEQVQRLVLEAAAAREATAALEARHEETEAVAMALDDLVANVEAEVEAALDGEGAAGEWEEAATEGAATEEAEVPAAAENVEAVVAGVEVAEEAAAAEEAEEVEAHSAQVARLKEELQRMQQYARDLAEFQAIEGAAEGAAQEEIASLRLQVAPSL